MTASTTYTPPTAGDFARASYPDLTGEVVLNTGTSVAMCNELEGNVIEIVQIDAPVNGQACMNLASPSVR